MLSKAKTYFVEPCRIKPGQAVASELLGWKNHCKERSILIILVTKLSFYCKKKILSKSLELRIVSDTGQYLNICPVHLLRQNYFCPQQNENCPGQNHFCQGQKILSEAKKSFFIQFITNDELFIHVQNILFRTKNTMSETILILSRTKIILSGQMDWA